MQLIVSARALSSVAEHLARVDPSKLSVAHAHLAIDDRSLVADRALDKSRRAAGKIVHQLRLPLGNLVGIEHVHVGAHPGLERPTILESDHACRSRRKPPYRFGDGIEPALAYPV